MWRPSRIAPSDRPTRDHQIGRDASTVRSAWPHSWPRAWSPRCAGGRARPGGARRPPKATGQARQGAPSEARGQAEAKADAKAATPPPRRPPAAAGARAQRATPSPAPSPLAEEAQHIARYDAAIAPVRDLAISRRGRARACARRSRPQPAASWPKAQGAARQDRRPAGRKLVDWYLYRGGYGTAARDPRLPGRQSGLARPRAC